MCVTYKSHQQPVDSILSQWQPPLTSIFQMLFGPW